MRKGQVMGEEQKRKIGAANKGKKRTIEQRKKMGLALKGRRLSKEHVEKIRIGHAGKNNYLWQGIHVSYRALHLWVCRWKGKPRYCEHCKRTDFQPRQYHWANVSGKYLRDLSDYIRLCIWCHRIFDGRKL